MLAEIQTACADYLNGTTTPAGPAQVTFFSTSPAIKVFTEQLADYESAIEREVESLGLCLLILTITAKDAQSRGQALAFGDIDVRARALCDPAINNTGVSASACAEAAAWFLRLLAPLENEGPLVFKSIDLVEDRSAPLAYDAIFTLSAKSSTAPSRS